ncbi:MAG: methylenetetrahydrofolate reductase [Lawsonella clevelandensis]
MLQAFADNDIHNVLALRGDPPGDPLGVRRKHPDGVEFASELVEIIRERGGFHIGAGGIPELVISALPTLEADTQFTLQKLRAGQALL